MGTLALGTGICLGFRVAQIPALLVIILASAAAWPVSASGTRSYAEVRAAADRSGADWIDEHMDRAHRFAPAYCGAAGSALLALLLPLRWPAATTALGTLASLAAATCVGVGLYIAQPALHIRHAKFQSEKSKPLSPLALPDGGPP